MATSPCGRSRIVTTATTPGIDPRPPSTTIAKMKIENENWNWAALTTPR